MKTTILGIPISLRSLAAYADMGHTWQRGVSLQVGPLKLAVRAVRSTVPRPGAVAVRVAGVRLTVDNLALTVRAPTGATYTRIARTTPEAIDDGVEPVIFRFPPDEAVVLANPDDFCPEMYLPDYLPNLATLRQGFGVRAERV